MSGWSQKELEYSVRTYMWMLTASEAGYNPNKAAVTRALKEKGITERSLKSLEFRFQNISSVLNAAGKEWLKGYAPKDNVGAGVTPQIEKLIKKYDTSPYGKRLNYLVRALPAKIVLESAKQLSNGEDLPFKDSTTYDIVYNGSRLPPKKVIAYAAKLHFRAPFFWDNIYVGDGSACFQKLEEAGLEMVSKVLGGDIVKGEEEEQKFRKKVNRRKKKGFKAPPKGNSSPNKKNSESYSYERDADVVAWVEKRAKGDCEHCLSPAPFFRADGSPYLEVHHITPLSEGGPDIIGNAAALCPNCHRRCHSGVDKGELRKKLSEIVKAKELKLPYGNT